jgi:Rod binding domain-containing protein
MGSFAVDPSLALQEAASNSLVQRKLDMNSLRQRFGDTATREQKLREACEGFEAIFLQKMWKQMRQTVPKGYLDSKDAEMYQSMFDIELSKKMASAGGIGLADMLYEQLSQQLENKGRTTRPSAAREFMPIAPATGLLPGQSDLETAAAAPTRLLADADKKLTIEALYTPLDQEAHDEEPLVTSDTITNALNELRAELNLAPTDALGATTAVTGLEPVPHMPSIPVMPPVDIPPPARSAAVINPSTASWQGPGPLSAKPRPISSFGGNRMPQSETADAPSQTDNIPAQPRGMLPSETLWPLSGEQGAVTSRFGWEDDPASGKRRWNSGVWIAAAPDTPVRAVLPGTVVYAGPREGRGHSVVLEHQNGYRSYYSNLEPSPLQIGEHIRHGAEFARIAEQPSPAVNRENSASLHFELKRGEMAINPESAINRT